jgi:two-component system, NtrC family, response regulator AtoC
MEHTVLIIDDLPSILESMKVFFLQRDWKVYTSLEGLKGLAMARKLKPRLVILDIKLPDIDGLTVLEKLKKELPQTQVIIVTAHQDMENTIASIKMGAFDFIHKPIDIHEMDAALFRLSKLTGPEEKEDFSQVQEKSVNCDTPYIVGKSMAIKEVFKKIALVADSKVTVLIQGESGTGKELIAKAIHFQGGYRKQPFMVMDCSTLVDTLTESELFGHEKGAFTGADSTFVGRLEKAGGGTIFFDEIGEMPLQTQSKLLRFLHEKEFVRVGGTKVIRSNARILAATNRKLDSMMNQKNFREDLFHRLSVMTIHVPPLRERKSDIPLLAEYLIKKICAQIDIPAKRIDASMVHDIFSRHDWPGNVRQLENTLTRAVLMAKSSILTEEDLQSALGRSSVKKEPTQPFKRLWEIEKDYIVNVLNAVDWHFGKTCRILGISRPTLRAKLKKYEISEKG